MQPPIVPGDYQPPTLAALMPAPPTPKRPWLGYVAAGAVALVVAGVLTVIVLQVRSGGTAAAEPTSTSAPVNDLYRAWDKCGGRIYDDNTTLIADLEGEDPNTGSLRMSHLDCLLVELKAPTYVRELMGKTRALDGRQEAEWGRYEASWTYHPDNGLDVIIRDVG